VVAQHGRKGLDGTNLWIASLPAIAAFLLGFAQEWLYGAR